MSGKLYTIYFEASLQELRPILDQAQVLPPTLPDKAIYADDADFIDEGEGKRKEQLIKHMKPVLGKANLKVNETKTEHTTLERKRKGSNEEQWNENVSLKRIREMENSKEARFAPWSHRRHQQTKTAINGCPPQNEQPMDPERQSQTKDDTEALSRTCQIHPHLQLRDLESYTERRRRSGCLPLKTTEEDA